MKDQIVQFFLDKMKACVNAGAYQIEDTAKNRSTRMDYGFTIEDQEAVLLQLTVDDYSKYEDNHDPNLSPVWVFKTIYEGHRFYVKYYFVNNEAELVIVMSDHLDDNEMNATWHR